jgi:hypothetical protein
MFNVSMDTGSILSTTGVFIATEAVGGVMGASLETGEVMPLESEQTTVRISSTPGSSFVI